MKKTLFMILIVSILFFPFCRKEKNKNQKNIENNKTFKESEKNKPILNVEGRIYTNKDFLSYLKGNLGKKVETFSNEVYLSIFDEFVEEILIYTYAKKQGVQISAAEIKYYLDKMNIGKENIKLESYIMRKLIVEKYISEKIMSKIKITENEARRFYNNNMDLFRKPEEIQLSQIVVDNENEVLKIKTELKKDPSLFPTLAEQESSGQGKNKNGDMGYFTKGELPESIEKVVFSLKKGDISRIVKSPFGYHIFMVTNRKEKRLLPFEYCKNTIKLKIKQKEYKKRLKELKNEVKKIINFRIIKKNIPFDYKHLKENTKLANIE